MSFKDHFSNRAAEYAQYRPHYPPALFECLAGLAPGRECAWDCATGNGQAALGLAPLFQRVIATDASRKQIENAHAHEKVSYHVASAGHSEIATAAIDLITVAQALHWFDLDPFYAEAARVLKPGGILAVWGYNLLSCGPGVDEIVNDFYYHVVGPYWPAERKIVEDGFRTVPFPFPEVEVPSFCMAAFWEASDLLGYLTTWSAVERFKQANGSDPVEQVRADLLRAWGEDKSKRRVEWPLHFRVGRLWGM